MNLIIYSGNIVQLPQFEEISNHITEEVIKKVPMSKTKPNMTNRLTCAPNKVVIKVLNAHEKLDKEIKEITACSQRQS